MRRYETSKKRIWIPLVAIDFIAALVVFILYKDFYLVATVLLIPLFFLPSIMRAKRGDPDLVIIDSKLVKRGLPLNKEIELSEFYDFKIEKTRIGLKAIYGYKLVDEVKIRELIIRAIYQDSLETILKKFYSGMN